MVKEQLGLAKYVPPNMFGWQVHIETGLLPEETVSKALIQHHMRRSRAMATSDMFIAHDVSAPSLIVTWAAMLNADGFHCSITWVV